MCSSFYEIQLIVFILEGSNATNASVQKHYNPNNDPHRAANSYLQRQEQQHNQQFYQSGSDDMMRNGATRNHIPLATIDDQQQKHVPYQSNNNIESTQNYHYQPDQYQHQKQQQPRLKLKKDT